MGDYRPKKRARATGGGAVVTTAAPPKVKREVKATTKNAKVDSKNTADAAAAKQAKEVLDVVTVI